MILELRILRFTCPVRRQTRHLDQIVIDSPSQCIIRLYLATAFTGFVSDKQRLAVKAVYDCLFD